MTDSMKRINATLPPSLHEEVKSRLGGRKLSPVLAHLLTEWLEAGAPLYFHVVPTIRQEAAR